MKRTKDEVVVILLLLIMLLFTLWVSTIVLFYYKTIECNQLKNEPNYFYMPSTSLNVPYGEIIKESINYMGVEEKPVISGDIKQDNKIYLGNFKITHYCACKKCCGVNAQGITASGKKVEANKTIAVDTNVIKLGSKVLIDGYGEYEAQDTGSAIKGNIIDVYIPNHEQALKLGVVYKDVYLLKGE